MLYLLLTIYIFVYYQENVKEDTDMKVRFWLESETMCFYTVIFCTILFLVISTFYSPKITDPDYLIDNYDYLELIVSDTTNDKLVQVFTLELFPLVMFAL